MDTNSNQFRIITAVASVLALAVPIFNANPIEIKIFSQAFNVFVLPLVILGIILLLNNKKIMKGYKTEFGINFTLALALLFACVVSYNGMVGVLAYFN